MTDESRNRCRWYLWLLGQDDNIGDIALRRRLLRAAERTGAPHVYVGKASPGYVEALTSGIACTTYTSSGAWYRHALVDTQRRASWGFAFNPGEVRANRQIASWYLKLVPLLLVARCRRKRVISVGLGLHSDRRPWVDVIRGVTNLASDIVWRDDASVEWAQWGLPGVDWAFDEQLSDHSAPDEARDQIALVFRGDRDRLSDEHIREVRQFAAERQRSLVVVVQVQSDNDASIVLARRLGADILDWPADRSHLDQEVACRSVYARSSYVLGDRIHGLILASSEGALPIGLATQMDSKLSRHLTAAGLGGLQIQLQEEEAVDLAGALRDRAEQAVGFLAALEQARSRARALDKIVTLEQ